MGKFYVYFDSKTDMRTLMKAVRGPGPKGLKKTVFGTYNVRYTMKERLLVANTLLDERYAHRAIQEFLRDFKLVPMICMMQIACDTIGKVTLK